MLNTKTLQEPQQNGGGGAVVAGDIVVGGPGLMGNPLVLQRAGVANPPDVSLPGAAGRDPPPPDFDIDRMGALHNQRLPDMALDADQAQGQAAAAAQVILHIHYKHFIIYFIQLSTYFFYCNI